MTHYATGQRRARTRRTLVIVLITLAAAALAGALLKVTVGDASPRTTAAAVPVSSTRPVVPVQTSSPAPATAVPSISRSSQVFVTPTHPIVSVLPTQASPVPTNALGKPYKLATYVVKQGDNLTKIAQWFAYNSYGQLFIQNQKLISNPNLIFPGQTLTVWSSGGMTLGD